MYRIVVMGDSGSVMGFRALGLEVCPADIAEEGRAALTPAVILIPGKEGSLGIGMEQVKTTAERAVGADMI